MVLVKSAIWFGLSFMVTTRENILSLDTSTRPTVENQPIKNCRHRETALVKRQ
jgi:hypothetical protein